jgi:glycosyltransferase involved in cell wall biosynthesis
MKLAFYAPLKSPNHTVPSGDRAMGRALLSALKDGGHDVSLVSELRLYEPKGCQKAQAALQAAADAEIDRITPIARQAHWNAWVTYHNYYKAPDLIGPKVAKALSIPYILIEATRAKSRLKGPWADFAHAAEAASDAAAAIFYLTQRDGVSLKRDAPDTQIVRHLHPFLDRAALPEPSTRSGSILSVAMMREGDKLASYQLIADTLAQLPNNGWKLEIAGDGPAADQIKSLMAPFGDKVVFHGALDHKAVAQLYSQAAVLLWPGVNEAFGFTYLEAQAAGVPVVTQDRPGVRDVVQGTHHPHPDLGIGPMAEAIAALLSDKNLQDTRSKQARKFVQDNHLRGAATRTLNTLLEQVTGTQT